MTLTPTASVLQLARPEVRVLAAVPGLAFQVLYLQLDVSHGQLDLCGQLVIAVGAADLDGIGAVCWPELWEVGQREDCTATLLASDTFL